MMQGKRNSHGFSREGERLLLTGKSVLPRPCIPQPKRNDPSWGSCSKGGMMLREKIFSPQTVPISCCRGRCQELCSSRGRCSWTHRSPLGRLCPAELGGWKAAGTQGHRLSRSSPFRHFEFFLPAMLKYTNCLMPHYRIDPVVLLSAKSTL